MMYFLLIFITSVTALVPNDSRATIEIVPDNEKPSPQLVPGDQQLSPQLPDGHQPDACNEGSVTYNNLQPRVYFLCIGGQWVQQFCAHNLVFDYESKRCKPQTTLSCKNGEKRPKLDNPKQFLYCVKGTWELVFCARNSVYDPINQDCELESTPAPVSQCKNGIRRPNMDNPRLWWLCQNGKWIIRQCAGKMVYNPIKNICEVPKTPPITECIEGQRKPKRGHPTEYWLCERGRWIIAQCPESLLYNSKTNACDVPTTPVVIECIEGQRRPRRKHSTEYWFCEKGGWVIAHCPEGGEYDSVKQICEEIAFCVEGTQQSYPSDEHAFLKCVDGSWEWFRCPFDEIFDKETKLCVKTAVCADGTKKISDQISEHKYLLCVGGTWKGFACPNDEIFYEQIDLCEEVPACVEGSQKSYPGDEHTYLKCVHGTWNRLKCPNYEIFNNETKKCGRKPKPVPTKPPKICKEGAIRPDKSNILKYQLCSKDQWVVKDCPINQTFDASSLKCIPKPPGSTECTENKLLPDLYFNEQYFRCINGSWKTQKCPSDQVYNVYERTGILCKDRKDLQAPSGQCYFYDNNHYHDISIQGDLYNPYQYFLCEKNEWKVKKCSTKEVFNLTSAWCQGGSSFLPPVPTTECTQGTKQPDRLNPQRYFICDGNKWKSEGCKDGDYNQKTVSCGPKPKPPPKGEECIKGNIEPDFNNHQGYFSCVSGYWKSIKCQNGYYFNPTTNTCEAIKPSK